MRRAAAALAAALLLVAGCGDARKGTAGSAGAADDQNAQIAASLGLAGIAFSAPLEKPRFALTDGDGQRFDFHEETAGKVTLLFFGYTSCPDVCPAHMASLASAFAAHPELRDRVRVVFVGVDADRDKPDVVKRWLAHFDPSFIGLTGDALALERAQRAAMVAPARIESRFEGGYSVGHASSILLYTADGWGRLRYPIGVTPEQWAHDLLLLSEHGWPSADAAPAVGVRDLRIPLPPGDVAALYGTFVDEGGGGDRLLAIRSPRARNAMLHQTTIEGGEAHMREAEDGLPIPPAGSVTLAPGGAHGMLMGLDPPLAAGERVPIVLVFERAGEVPVEVPVEGSTAP